MPIDPVWWSLGGFVLAYVVISVIAELRFRRKMRRLRELINRGGDPHIQPAKPWPKW